MFCEEFVLFITRHMILAGYCGYCGSTLDVHVSVHLLYICLSISILFDNLTDFHKLRMCIDIVEI